jgi:RHS repeat-associated protein
MEGDEEIKGAGNSYDFGARMYDSRVGRWLAKDPKMQKYPGWSSYHFAYCSPLIVIDPNGKENIVVIGNSNDPEDEPPHPHPRQVLLLGLEIAKRLRDENTDNNEGTKILIYAGNYEEVWLNEFINELANEDGIEYEVYETADEISNYVNEKNGGNSRDQDKVTDFAYVGHSSSQKLLVGFGVRNYWEEYDYFTADDFEPSAFSQYSCADLIGCRTANEDGGRINITQRFAANLIGGSAQGAPFDVLFGYTNQDVKGGAGNFFYQNSDESGKGQPNIYEGRAQSREKIQLMPIKEIINNNNEITIKEKQR